MLANSEKQLGMSNYCAIADVLVNNDNQW